MNKRSRQSAQSTLPFIPCSCERRRTEPEFLNKHVSQKLCEPLVSSAVKIIGLLLTLIGKAGHIHTVPMPDWVKGTIDDWVNAAGIGDLVAVFVMVLVANWNRFNSCWAMSQFRQQGNTLVASSGSGRLCTI